MMRQATILAVLITAAQLSFASPNGKAIPHNPIDGDTTFSSIPDPQEMLAEIMNVTGLQADFELKAADVQNIQASISHRKRNILYNPEYVSWLNKLTRSKWCMMTLIAHEVGHHLNGHTMRKGGSSPAVELEADEFAGFVLFKLGATLEESQLVMKYIAGLNASSTHPGRLARMNAIKTGWEKASATSSAAR